VLAVSCDDPGEYEEAVLLPGLVSDATIGFFIEADRMAAGGFVGFVDSSSPDGAPAALAVRWR